MESPPSAKPAQFIGRYAIYDAIAAGGMATVHYGRLLGPVGFSRTVAIKRLHAQFASDPEFVSMFLDEARLAARIRHPNVVPTLDVVATGGELFLVMEYVAGEALARLVRTSAALGTIVPPRIVLAIMCGVLRGLHAAHDATNERGEPLGIVHRDVSPQNVLVGIDGHARVLDFGVAKAAGRLQTTRDGKLKGKLAYMAPEQLRGKTVDRRTDIFAAATVLWEALSGRRLFRGDNEGAIVTKILEGDVGPPSEAVPAGEADEESRAVLRAVDAITLKGLSLRPEDRFDTAREMAAALERAIPSAGVSEVSEWVEQHAKEVLGTRARLVADIESNSTVAAGNIAGIRAASEESESIPALTPHRVTSGEETDSISVVMPPAGGDASSVSAASQVHARTVPPTRARRTWAVGVLGGVVGLLGLLFAVHASRSSDVPMTAASVPVPARSVAAVDPPSSASAPPVAASPPEPSAAPAPPPSAPPATAAIVVAKSPPTAAAPHPPARVGGRAATTHATAANGCDPPYTFDAQGMKHYKPECF